MKKLLISIVLALTMVLFPMQVLADTTADVTIAATPEYISISVAPDNYDFEVVAASATPSTLTNHFAVTNGSTVNIDVAISVLFNPWESVGTGWTHDNGGSASANTTALLANKGGTWGVGDVIVKSADPNNITSNESANFDFGLKLLVPTSFPDANENTNTLWLSATKYVP